MKNKKSLGQHWLKNRVILDQIASLASEGTDASLVLEIGPGLGTLTSSLLKRFARVVAVEYDADLAAKLPGQFPGKNLEVINADILQVHSAEIVGNANFAVVGNIPYYITSPIVKKVLEMSPRPQRIVLLMQKEVAERIAAESGRQNLLSLFVQNLAEVELGPVVKAAEFTPPPRVDSQIIMMTPLDQPVIDESALKFAKLGFASPRKKLAHNLAGVKYSKEQWRTLLERQGINPDCRPADLSLWDWEELAKL